MRGGHREEARCALTEAIETARVERFTEHRAGLDYREAAGLLLEIRNEA